MTEIRKHSDIWVEIANINQLIEKIEQLVSEIKESANKIKQQATKNCAKVGG